jgi:hypothetical protein
MLEIYTYVAWYRKLNFVSNDPSDICCVLPLLNASQRMSWCVLEVAREVPVKTVEFAFCTQNLPDRYPLVARKDILAERMCLQRKDF